MRLCLKKILNKTNKNATQTKTPKNSENKTNKKMRRELEVRNRTDRTDQKEGRHRVCIYNPRTQEAVAGG